MTGWTIRLANEEDAGTLGRCIDAAYAIYDAREVDLPPVSEGVAADIVAHHVWVAEAGNAIVGGAILIVRDGFALLANVAVHPDFVGRGLGRALMERAERQARNLSISELRLNTHASIGENVRLYEHLGWRETERSGSKVSMSKQL